MATIQLAELLLRRKELNERILRLQHLNQKELYEIKAKRINVTDSVDDITASVPKVKFSDVTAMYDYYARQLRLVDSHIQQANWTTTIDTGQDLMKDYVSPDV